MTAMDPPNNPDGHGSPKCGAKLRQGPGTCKREAGAGTDHKGVGACWVHGGRTRSHRKHNAPKVAELELRRLGRPLEGADPQGQLLAMVCEAAGNVAALRGFVLELDQLVVEEIGPGGARREAISAYAVLYQTWTSLLVTYASSAIKCGIAERQVVVAEQQAALVAKVMMAFLDDPEFGLTREQRDLGRRLAGRHLRALSPVVVAA